MLEIGKYTTEAHERVGRAAAQRGGRSLYRRSAREVHRGSRAQARMRSSAIYSFDTAEEAGKPLQALMRQGDLVLVKGSHAMALDKVVEEIKVHSAAIV